MAEDEPATNINVQSVNIPPPPEFEMFLTASEIKDDTQTQGNVLCCCTKQVLECVRFFAS